MTDEFRKTNYESTVIISLLIGFVENWLCVKILILDSEWSDECIDFTMVCGFLFFFCVCHHPLG